jgi:hypothetical protein
MLPAELLDDRERRAPHAAPILGAAALDHEKQMERRKA